MSSAKHFWGGVLLVAGTSIGAGMLALPVITAFGGFFPSIGLFLIVWGLMLASAFFFLEVNLVIKGEPNLISMAGKTLGTFGKGVSWVFYLLLLYSLLAAYLSACAPLFASAYASLFHHSLPPGLSPFLLPILFGGCICFGTKGVDYVNRLLMVCLVISYGCLLGFAPEHLSIERLFHSDIPASLFALPVVITSFGYHIIIPTLTTYVKHDAKLLRKILWTGSSFPLIVYVLWQIAVLGVVPLPALAATWKAGAAATEPLSSLAGAAWVSTAARFFSFFAIITSFLGVALSLSDFLADGFRLKKSWEGKVMAVALSFAPPLLFLLFCERSFYVALEYAGSFVAILLGILPSWMLLRLRTEDKRWYKRKRGRAFIGFVMALFCAVIVVNFLEKWGYFHDILRPYLAAW